mmetsp:Transcript_14040/g.33160  ORF Transcript_14040/g.33160 Transcript_14040/m.33160 type:complete len:203 (+) Transcript_14040:831-1439(+)
MTSKTCKGVPHAAAQRPSPLMLTGSGRRVAPRRGCSPGISTRNTEEGTSKARTAPSDDLRMAVLPSALIATDTLRLSNDRGVAVQMPASRSHIFTIPSCDALTAVRELSPSETEVTLFSWPSSSRRHFPCSMSNRRSLPLSLPEIARRPSMLTSKQVTSDCPSGEMCRLSFSEFRSKTLTWPSLQDNTTDFGANLADMISPT